MTTPHYTREERNAALGVDCPFCGAPTGVRCDRADNSGMPHAKRVRAATEGPAPVRTPVELLSTDVNAIAADIAYVVDRMHEAARRHSFCSQYDEIVDVVNRRLTTFKIPVRPRRLTAYVEATFTGSQEELNELVRAAVRADPRATLRG